MRLIIAGSRTFTDYDDAAKVIEITCALNKWKPVVVLCGGAAGVDALGKRWALENGCACVEYPADWSQGRKAGPLRNAAMIENADALIAIWDGRSRGTADMIRRAVAAKLPHHVYEFASK